MKSLGAIITSQPCNQLTGKYEIVKDLAEEGEAYNYDNCFSASTPEGC